MRVGTELDAMNRAYKALDWLSDDAKARVLLWLASKFNVPVIYTTTPSASIPYFPPLPRPTEGASHG